MSPAGERCECILDAGLVLWAGLRFSTQGLGTDRAPPHSFPPIPQPGTHTHTRLLGRPPSCPQLVRAAGLRSHFVSGWAKGPRGEAGCASLMPGLPGRAGE